MDTQVGMNKANFEVLIPTEVANLLNVPLHTVRKLAREHKLPGAFRVGKHWRFLRIRIEEWLEDQKRQLDK